MKITIDTTNKTIKVEDQVNFCELNKELKKLLGDAVKEYTLLPYAYSFTTYPAMQPYYYPTTSPIYPTVYCGNTGQEITCYTATS